jgi:hypothetical protein
MCLIAVAAVCLLIVRAWLGGPELGRGSVAAAARWKGIFEAISDPEVVKTRYPFAAVKRFDDGSWIVGVGEDSHASSDGGTIVVKESDGSVRAFFGHVCGPDLLADAFSRCRSSAEFYPLLFQSRFGFKEYTFP